MAFLRYSLQRLLLLLATLAILWVAGLRGLWLPLVGVFTSGLLAIVVLKGSRGAASAALAGRLRAVNERIDRSAQAEDDDAEVPRGPDDRA